MGQIVALAVIVLAVCTAAHAVLYKRDARAVIAWVAFIVLLPFLGAILYWLLAVNRVERKARKLRPHLEARQSGKRVDGDPERPRLARIGDTVSPFPLCAANRVRPLEDGDAAYPPMFEAIEAARESVVLATYIFDGDEAGRRFGQALADAVGRGVEVRVLIDAHGGINRKGSMVRWLRAAGVPVAEFMPSFFRSAAPGAFNMRNHRKLLVTDGRVAFTGGMNISGDNLLAGSPSHPVRDLHFMFEGPVVGQIARVFADDWIFATGERLEGERWFPSLLATSGETLARAIPDGPDDHLESLKLVIMGALAEARRSVSVMTPYFLPDQGMIAALNIAALRGVTVDIVLPGENDHPVVQWAARAQYWQMLEHGCRIWHSPPPFDHSKLMVVDAEWCLLGSTNWDPRSLRLNFELNVECHDPALGADLQAWFERRRDAATPISKAEMDGRSLPVRLRDGAARLMTPYL